MAYAQQGTNPLKLRRLIIVMCVLQWVLIQSRKTRGWCEDKYILTFWTNCSIWAKVNFDFHFIYIDFFTSQLFQLLRVPWSSCNRTITTGHTASSSTGHIPTWRKFRMIFHLKLIQCIWRIIKSPGFQSTLLRTVHTSVCGVILFLK